MRQWIIASAALAGMASGVAIADTYKIDSAHSSVGFAVKHSGVTEIFGIFSTPAGKLDLKDGGAVTIVIKADTINTGIAKRDQHLKSNDYFAVEQYPTIKFESEKVEKTEKGFKLTGNLTLRGVTKPLTVELVATGTGKAMDGSEVAGFMAEFSIKRSDFGLTSGIPAVSDEVKLYVSLEAAKQ